MPLRLFHKHSIVYLSNMIQGYICYDLAINENKKCAMIFDNIFGNNFIFIIFPKK